ncbi:HAD family hydrolase [Corynebacterium pseudokroppenstedtii]|uniref:HAD family hydrolase n=1 Tax=Corynebacterium pseudokroppenstedtii TaxID=2804917 RepID=UPI00307ABB3A
MDIDASGPQQTGDSQAELPDAVDLARQARAPLLVASDIDGTFVTSAERVTPRLTSAIHRMVRAGTSLVLATGRPARWTLPVIRQLPVRPLCVCTNGSVIFDSAREEVLTAHEIPPEHVADMVQRVMDGLASDPREIHVGFGVERVGTDLYSEKDQFLIEPNFDHVWESQGFSLVSVEELVAEPTVKLLLRSPEATSEELYQLVAPMIPVDKGHVTYSFSGGLLEIAAPGVNKAGGLAEVADLLGVDAGETVAFGDMPNDTEMLQWARMGVAMGNAHPMLLGVAKAVTTSNDEDGVARVIDAWF